MNQTILPSPDQELSEMLRVEKPLLTSNKVHEAAFTFKFLVEFYDDAEQVAARVTRELTRRLDKLALQQEKLNMNRFDVSCLCGVEDEHIWII